MSIEKKTLYVTDLDGTLLNTKVKISDFSLQVINSLVDRGLLFSYATARSLSSASIVTKGLSTMLPVIVYNGTFLINPVTKEVLSSIGFSKKQTSYLKNILEENKIFPLVYSYLEEQEKVSWLCGQETEGMKYYLANREGDRRMTPLSDYQKLYQGQVFYMTCIGEKEKLQPVFEMLKDHSEYNCIFQQELYRQEYWCEIMPKNATKAQAILKLKEITGCERIVSFGDAINDLPMFSISDECYAVENAVEKLKRAATGIIASNDKDGLAHWLLENIK